MRRLVNACTLVLVTMVTTLVGPGAVQAAVPAYHPSRLAHVGDARQMIVVTGRSTRSTYATLRAYSLGSDGRWRQHFADMFARIGYAGWVSGTKRREGSGTTPRGTYTITTAFGVAADPGTALPYTRVDGNDYWVGDSRDPRTYNLFQKSASASRTWRIGTAERLAAYPTQYRYVAVIDFNRPARRTVSWDSRHREYVDVESGRCHPRLGDLPARERQGRHRGLRFRQPHPDGAPAALARPETQTTDRDGPRQPDRPGLIHGDVIHGA